MIREMDRPVRYYERFQVEDVLTFFTGQLIQARSTDGAKVMLQEIKLMRPLPPGSREMLYHLQHPHMLSILDVILERGVVVLVHPVFSGDPLPLVVNKNQPMEPVQALHVYRKLIQTVIDLAKFPIPMYTTLDPRNICMSGDQPFVLFVGLKKYTPQPRQDQTRNLLYYLLSGEHPKDVKYRHQDLNKRIRKVPASIRQLALDILENDYTPEQILKKTDEVIEKHQAKPREKGQWKKDWIFPAVAVATLLIGALIGYSMAYTDLNQQEMFSVNQTAAPADGKQSKPIHFEGEKVTTVSLDRNLDQPSIIKGEVTQNTLSPFSVRLVSNGEPYTIGFKTDEEGRIQLFQSGEEFQQEIRPSDDAFRMEADKPYQVKLFFTPNEPLRVTVQDQESGDKWVAVGTVPLLETYRVEVKGMDGTVFENPAVDPVHNQESSKVEWMGSQPWNLVFGEGVLKEGRFSLDSNVLVQLDSQQSPTFTFRRKEGFTGDPLQVDMESVDGNRFKLLWTQTGKLQFYRVEVQEEMAVEKNLGWNWDPREETDVTVTSENNRIQIHIRQGDKEETLEYTHIEPLTFRDFSIKSSSGLELIDPSS